MAKTYFTVSYDVRGNVINVTAPGRTVKKKRIKQMKLDKASSIKASPAVIISKPGGSPCCVGSGGWGWCWC